jgi:putative FmdB family regulatory protein
MPIYEYECSDCHERYEIFQSISDEPIKKCMKCNGNIKRIISGGTGLIFKGSGFYITDYKNNKNPKI